MAEDESATPSHPNAPKSESNSSRDLAQEVAPVIKGDPSRDDPSHRSFMGSSRFATRHSLFTVLGLLAIGAMTALFFHADQLLSKSLDQVRTASHLASLVSRIESATLALNSDGQNFILNRDLRYAENYQKRSEVLARDLKLLMEDPAATDAQKMATTLNDGVAQHAGQFSNIVKINSLLGFGGEDGLAGNAKASFAALEKRIGQLTAQLKDSDTRAGLGAIRTSELQMAQSPTDKTLQQVQIDIGLLNKTLVASALSDAEKKTVLTMLQSHRSDVTQLGRTWITLTKAITLLGEINTYMAPSLDTLINYSGNFSLLARQESKTTQEFIRQLLAGGSGATLLLLIFFGLILMGSISKPARRISEVALELAHGNVSAPIPYLGNYDESGEIASALAIFRENMLQADRLRKDLELALKQQAAEIVVPPLAETTEEALEDLKAEIKEEIEEDMADKIEGPGRGLIPHADNLPAEPEPQSDDGADGEPAEPQLPIGKSAITSISQQVTTTSQNASIAAEEAERTEQMVAGLDEATEKIEDIEILMIGISDQMSLLSVQTALLDGGTDAENLIHLDEKRSKKKSPAKSASGQSVSDRIETIQGGTKRAIKAAQNIGRTLNDVNETAKDFAATASKEALEAANELLRQSEDLRTLLDNLLGKVETGGNQSKAKE